MYTLKIILGDGKSFNNNNNNNDHEYTYMSRYRFVSV